MSKQRNRLTSEQLVELRDWLISRGPTEETTRRLAECATDALGHQITEANIIRASAMRCDTFRAAAPEDVSHLASELLRLMRIADISPIDQSAMERIAAKV